MQDRQHSSITYTVATSNIANFEMSQQKLATSKSDLALQNGTTTNTNFKLLEWTPKKLWSRFIFATETDSTEDVTVIDTDWDIYLLRRE